MIYSDTHVEHHDGGVLLVHEDGTEVVRLTAAQIPQAIRDGLYDPEDPWGSLIEYARLRDDLPSPADMREWFGEGDLDE